MFLIAIAYRCTNLESLMIEDLDDLAMEAMNVLFTERSNTLKTLRICGLSITDEMLEKLPKCQKLEHFELVHAHKIGPA